MIPHFFTPPRVGSALVRQGIFLTCFGPETT